MIGTMLYNAERSVLIEMIDPHIIPYTPYLSDLLAIAESGGGRDWRWQA
jgi:hypothetical protein